MKTLAGCLVDDTAPSGEDAAAWWLNCGSEGAWRTPSMSFSGVADARGQHLSGVVSGFASSRDLNACSAMRCHGALGGSHQQR